MIRALALSAALVPSVALADAPDLSDAFSTGVIPAVGAPMALPTGDRNYKMEISFRGRMMSVPQGILDIWYFRGDGSDGALASDDKPRPKIGGQALGVEFVVKGETGANGIFYFDYVDATMKEGYWDDKEEPQNPLDGDYIAPSGEGGLEGPPLGMVMFGADFGQDVWFVRTEDTNGAFGLSLVIGAGLGVGVIIGDLYEWGPEGVTPAYIRRDRGDPADGTKKIPKVLPVVDINAGLRFNFGDRVVLRVEGGLHDMIYYGATLGIMF